MREKDKKVSTVKVLRECRTKFEESVKEVIELMAELESQMAAAKLQRRIKSQKSGHPMKEDGDDLIF